VANKVQQVLDDPPRPLGCFHQEVGVVPKVVRQPWVSPDQLGEAEDGRERIVDFVGDPGRKSADGFHLLGTRPLDLGPALADRPVSRGSGFRHDAWDRVRIRAHWTFTRLS